MEDPEAAMMRVLYDEHAAALWRFALRLTGDQARSSVSCTTSSARAWRKQPAGLIDGRGSDTPYSARAWLFTVARNLIIDEKRSARYRRETGSPDLEGTAEPASPDEVDSALDRMLIGSALAQLSDVHRAVIGRAYYQGWSTAQIAADLDIPEGTVKSRLHYAVRALKLNLQELGVTR
jgi:RNA polymerase sigma-70 factor (ECF subfamily)